MNKAKIIFFGNGPLADYTLAVLTKYFEVIFHARTREDLAEVVELKKRVPEAYGVLASYGVIVKQDVLDLFEPVGILNIHPSKLPQLRGPSPIETAILNGDSMFTVSVMKLVKEMDAGPVYFQAEFEFDRNAPKDEIYQKLAEAGAEFLAKNLTSLPEPEAQKGEPTFSKMLNKSMSPLDPSTKTAQELSDQVRAFAGYPKSKYEFFGLDCTVISAHVATEAEVEEISNDAARKLFIQCKDKSVLVIDEIQPAGRKVMDAKSFLNGYKK